MKEVFCSTNASTSCCPECGSDLIKAEYYTAIFNNPCRKEDKFRLYKLEKNNYYFFENTV